MNIIKTQIDGCYELQPNIFNDVRGRFVKVFNETEFEENGLEVNFREQYYSVSKRNVIRGMHFQTPPFDHAKVVYCVKGSVFDAVIDLRVSSPTYGHAVMFELTAQKGNGVYIPKGMAHGFCTLSDESILIYSVSSIHSPECDAGLLWNSAGIPWPIQDPIISTRDKELPSIDRFLSPFK